MTLDIATKGLPRQARAPSDAHPLQRVLTAGLLSLSLWITGCASETLFQSSFNSNALGAPPSHVQSTGTIDLAGEAGSVVVVAAPPTATGQWARIRRAGVQSPITTMLGNFSAMRGDGTYTLLAAMFIPSGSGAATVEFDTGQAASPPSFGFLHLDFLPDNTVRVNDDSAQVFGSFPRDQFFSVAVTLNISASAATASISLFGSGASGSRDVNVTPLNFARQIGAVKFWMGFPWTGSFDVTDIIVTRRTN